MKQKLILITGSPCVGKTTVAERLFETCEDKTMSFALSNYLRSGFAYVIFSSVVIIGAEIREAILRDIDADGYTTVAFTLTCSEATLAERHRRRGDRTSVSYQWLRMPPCPGDRVLDTDGKTPAQLAAEIKRIADAAE